MIQLRAVVERITYFNEENGYSILKARVKQYRDLVTVVGTFPPMYIGTVLLLQGEWTIDPKYGQQFCCSSYEEALPATALGIEKYIGSGLIRGVGPSIAKKIVQTFGEKTLEVMDEQPELLLTVPGIGKKKIIQIQNSWLEQREIKNIMLFLQSHNVSTTHAFKIYKQYGNDSLAVLRKNPYQLADDIWGIGFRTADSIAMKLGIAKDSFFRIRSGLIFFLGKLADSGHCFAARNQLIQNGAGFLELEPEFIVMTLDQMIQNKDVIVERGVISYEQDEHGYTAPQDDAVYLPPFFLAENAIARKIIRLLQTPPAKQISEPEKKISVLLENSSIRLDEIQERALKTAAESKIMILTGGPGTGKTTTTNSIISLFLQSGLKVILAAPTGRAAKRMTETCNGIAAGMESKTIHRLLEYRPGTGYARNDQNPLEGDVLIIDECSMIDTLLMHHLLKAVPNHMRLLFIGDVDQLPSIGAGNVLKDLISSYVIPVTRLTRIFRQAENSLIVTNAHRINQGKMPLKNQAIHSDFLVSPCSDPEKAVSTIVDLCSRRIPASLHLDPFRDIQVLTPRANGPAGTIVLNQQLQACLNPNGKSLTRSGIVFREHDKVMQIHNNYDKEVFNGDIGFVETVDLNENTLTVMFDQKSVKYERFELDELALAYAVTIHKAQGSEYPVVIMPFLRSHFPMLQKNLLYTGITRAKKRLILLSDTPALSIAINSRDVIRRNTRLSERLAQFAIKR